MKEKKIILHLCADIGSDSIFYQNNPEYHVMEIGKDIGVENYTPPKNVYGIIANPPCQEFSIAPGYDKTGNEEKGLFLVEHCIRIIQEANPVWYVIENPATGRLKNYLGKPNYIYQPWEFGSPWTKKTALWGVFNKPDRIYKKWEDVPKIPKLYVRPGRTKPGLVYFHKSAVKIIPEMQWASEYIKTDADIRSMCSQGFAKAFYEANK